jgi:GNAT superfamily N-acetyltransferase
MSFKFTLLPLQPGDFDVLSYDDWTRDTHTLLKKYGDVVYLREDAASRANQRRDFANKLKNPRQMNVKAVDEDGNALGSIGIAYIGFDEETLSRINPPRAIEDDVVAESADSKADELPKGPISEAKKKANDAIDRLEAWEQEDWRKWENVFMPPGSKSVVVTGLSVNPVHQGKGVGTALVKWAASKADEAETYIWVHSSEAGWRAFQKGGFKEVGRLKVDLDAWAEEAGGLPVPKDVVDGDKWGVYTCRWMKRPAKKD